MLTYIIMPIIKNKIILAVTKLFKIEQLEVEFNNNQNRKYEIISGTGCDAVMMLPIMDNKIFFIKEYCNTWFKSKYIGFLENLSIFNFL